VPADWYILGYDTFAVHTFLRLIRASLASPDFKFNGYLRQYFEPSKSLLIDFSKELIV